MITYSRIVLLLWLGLLVFSTRSRAESLDFEIVPGTHPVPSSVRVELSALLAGSDDDASAISGEATFELEPITEPFKSVAIDTMELVLDDGMDLSLALGLLKAKAEPGATRVTLIEPGIPTEVVDGTFNQTENLFGFEGVIELQPEGELDLSTIAPILTDLENIRIFQEQTSIVAEIDFDLIFTGVVQGFEIDIAINGSARAVTGSRIAGDVNGDGMVDAGDIDALTEAIQAGSNESVFDIDGDGMVDIDDHAALIVDTLNTFFGDANLDREFSSADLVNVFAFGHYEDAIVGNSTWETGDWNADREFTSGDFVAAFEQGGYEMGPRQPVAVPEPGFYGLFFCVVFVFLRRCNA